jgi:hypothetical protein
MKNMTNSAVAGLISAALMVLAKLLLSQQPQLLAYHYPSFALAGQEGLYKLGLYCAWGAGYGLVYGLVLKMILPGGLFGPLFLGAVPTLVSALVLPMYHNEPAIREPWTLLWLFLNWTLYAIVLLFILGGKKGGKRDDD